LNLLQNILRALWLVLELFIINVSVPF